MLRCSDVVTARPPLKPCGQQRDERHSSLTEGAAGRPAVTHRQAWDRLPGKGIAGNCEEKPCAEGMIYVGLPKKGEEKRRTGKCRGTGQQA